VCFQIKTEAFDFARKGLKRVALVGSGRELVLFKLNNGLEAKSNGGDPRLEDPNKISGGSFCKVNDN
jgi:hypothetical protein